MLALTWYAWEEQLNIVSFIILRAIIGIALGLILGGCWNIIDSALTGALGFSIGAFLVLDILLAETFGLAFMGAALNYLKKGGPAN